MEKNINERTNERLTLTYVVEQRHLDLEPSLLVHVAQLSVEYSRHWQYCVWRLSVSAWLTVSPKSGSAAEPVYSDVKYTGVPDAAL